MAIITSSNIKIDDNFNQQENINIELDFNTKQLTKLPNFPTILAGDNNSAILVIKTPPEYKGIDLIGTNCVVSFNTEWTDANENYSSGQVDLSNTVEEIEEEGRTLYLLYTWVLDTNQTAIAGKCNFNISFLMNLQEDPYQNNTEIELISNEESVLLQANDILQTKLEYWSLSTFSSSFDVKNTNLTLDSDYNTVLPNDLEAVLNDMQSTLSSAQEKITEFSNYNYVVESKTITIDATQDKGYTGTWYIDIWNDGTVECRSKMSYNAVNCNNVIIDGVLYKSNYLQVETPALFDNEGKENNNPYTMTAELLFISTEKDCFISRGGNKASKTTDEGVTKVNDIALYVFNEEIITISEIVIGYFFKGKLLKTN